MCADDLLKSINRWRDVSYLRCGTSRQQAAWESLTKLNILPDLSAYDPLLVSTICHDIDTPTSDLDIICFAPNLPLFLGTAHQLFGQLAGFISALQEKPKPHALVNFQHHSFTYEVYAAPTPIHEQAACQHFLQTARLLSIGGPIFREKLRQLKTSGQKTEPAIAGLLRLEGDPYQAVLKLAELTDFEVAILVNQ